MHAACYCSRCHPTPAKEQCSKCGEEIRWGWRDGRQAYWHREPVDHVPAHGHLMTFEAAEALRARVEGREAEPEDEEKAALQRAEVEVWAHPVERTEFKPQSGIRQIANLVAGETRVNPETGKSSKSKKHPPAAPGWELVNITHARGPYRGSKGEVLSISDTHVLRARGPEVDGARKVAVGSWRDLGFDFAFIGMIKDGRLIDVRKVGSDEMKDWIKQ